MNPCVGKGWDEAVRKHADAELLRILDDHSNPSFWERGWMGHPTKAWVRNWSSRVRREARRRGLVT